MSDFFAWTSGLPATFTDLGFPAKLLAGAIRSFGDSCARLNGEPVLNPVPRSL